MEGCTQEVLRITRASCGYCNQAVKNLVQSSNLSRRVIFFIEGEEESAGIGSRRLLQLEGRKMFEDSKVVLTPDAGAISDTCECITVGLRGSASFTVSTKGPDSDLHSGIFGGLIPNPIFDAGKIIISLNHDSYDKIPGFLENYEEPILNELTDSDVFADQVDLLTEKSAVTSAGSIKCNKNILTLGLFPRIEVCGIGGLFWRGIRKRNPQLGQNESKLEISL